MLNPRRNCLRWIYNDWQSTNDVSIIVTVPPKPIRPRENDAYEVKELANGRIGVIHAEEKTRVAEADNIELTGPCSSSFCNACLSALGYLVSHLAEAQTRRRAVAAAAQGPSGPGRQDVEGMSSQTEASERAETGDWEGQSQISVVQHWNTMAMMRSVTVHDCTLCKVIWHRSLEEQLDVLEKDLIYHPRVELLFNTTDDEAWNGEKPGDARLISAFSTVGSVGPPSAKTYVNLLRFQFWPKTAEFDHFFARPSEHVLPAIENLAISSDADESAQESTRSCRPLALDWLAECKHNADGKHGSCNQHGSSWVPSRLLDIGNVGVSGKVRLVALEVSASPDKKSSEYITLSHCWGEWGARELPTLTQSNLLERQQEGIALTDLPKTFSEAVEIAGWFGVNYLWIDSLCIIQDSEQDWNHEAVLMCEVYKHAMLNISADASVDARGGCFRERNPSVIQPFQLHMKNLDRSFWVSLDERTLFDWLHDAPIWKRCWVYQERNLSRRVLHFTEHEVFWECRAGSPSFRSESYPRGSPLPRDFLGQTKLPAITSTSPLMADNIDLSRLWDRVCRDFSKRQLSYWTDRLPSLSGIAREFGQGCPGDTYIAGHWLSNLAETLLWSTLDDETPEPRPQQEFVVPSWSWLSVKYPIKTLGVPQHFHSIIDVKAFDRVTRGGEPYGRITRASLTLEGYVRKVTCLTKRKVLFQGDQEILDFYARLGTEKNQCLYVDGRLDRCVGFHFGALPPTFFEHTDAQKSSEYGRRQDYYCLLVGVSQSGEAHDRHLQGLLIESTGEPQQYRRVGTMWFSERTALRMRYRLSADTISSAAMEAMEKRWSDGHDPDDKSSATGPYEAEWSQLWNAVSQHWKAHDDRDRLSVTSSGPRSLYDFDAGASADGFERLTPETVVLV